jgi:hypothetical protein
MQGFAWKYSYSHYDTDVNNYRGSLHSIVSYMLKRSFGFFTAPRLSISSGSESIWVIDKTDSITIIGLIIIPAQCNPALHVQLLRCRNMKYNNSYLRYCVMAVHFKQRRKGGERLHGSC